MRLFVKVFLIITACTVAKKHRSKKLPQISEEKSRMLQGLDYKRSDDPSEDRYRNPVPFGHIYKEGFEDPRSDFKRPIDLMELDTFYVTDGPYAREFIKKSPLKYQPIRQQPLKMYKPIDLTGGDPEKRKALESPMDNNNETIRTYWNFEGLLTRNLQDPPKYRLGGGQRPSIAQADHGPDNQTKAHLFSSRTYALLNEMEEQQSKKLYNFTSCDEFGQRAKFHPNDIVNLDWVPFYIWTYEINGKVGISRVHQFTFPTKKFIKNFQEQFGPLLNKSVDWKQPKLVMKHGTSEFLLIAVDRTGLFEGVPYLNLPTDMKRKPGLIKVPTTPMRLKIVDPYLALMYCDHQYASVMGISGTEPDTPATCTKAAETVKIIGKGFPVKRDLHMEAMELRSKMAANAEWEQDKYISIDDQDQGAGSPLI